VDGAGGNRGQAFIFNFHHQSISRNRLTNMIVPTMAGPIEAISTALLPMFNPARGPDTSSEKHPGHPREQRDCKLRIANSVVPNLACWEELDVKHVTETICVEHVGPSDARRYATQVDAWLP